MIYIVKRLEKWVCGLEWCNVMAFDSEDSAKNFINKQIESDHRPYEYEEIILIKKSELI